MSKWKELIPGKPGVYVLDSERRSSFRVSNKEMRAFIEKYFTDSEFKEELLKIYKEK